MGFKEEKVSLRQAGNHPNFKKNALSSETGIVGSAKTDPVRFKWGSGEGLLKDEFAFLEACTSPIPKRRTLLAKRPFL